MSSHFPALFVSHGAPSLIIEQCPTREFLRHLGEQIGRPRGIVCVSAHWITSEPRVTMHPSPETIHDFGGFPDELYSLRYLAPGDPVLGQRVLTLLKEGGISGAKDMSRGLDHGAWAPLMLMYPDADIPLIQLSVQPHLGPEHHLAMGKALRPLREEGILILASGAATHNLRDFFGRGLNDPALPYAREFTDWLAEAIAENRGADLTDYARLAPHALRNHPTPEHLLPLFVPLGSGGTPRRIHGEFTYGVLSMAAFSWD